MAYDKAGLKEKVSTIEISSDKSLNQFDLAFLFNYELFPDYILSYFCQWTAEDRTMQIGDTIAQQVFIPPIQAVSQKIIFGVRVCEIFEESSRIGFSYETLVGHVEKGISTFSLEQLDGKTAFKIHTFSEPGNTLTRLLGPVFSLPYQAYCTRKCLKNVKMRLENQ